MFLAILSAFVKYPVFH